MRKKQETIIAILLGLLLSAMLSCSEDDPSAKQQPQSCEVKSNLATGPHWTIEVNTLSQQPNLVLSVEHISTEHMVRVEHKQAITTLQLDSEKGEYKIGLAVCGTGTSGLQYSIKVVKPNGSITNIAGSVGTMYVVNIQ